MKKRKNTRLEFHLNVAQKDQEPLALCMNRAGQKFTRTPAIVTCKSCLNTIKRESNES